MLRMGIELVLRHGAGCRDPLPQVHPWYVLIELSSQARSGLRAVLEEILAEAWSAACWRTPPSPRASTRPRCSGASASCSARCSATKAARSSMTSRYRSPRCRLHCRTERGRHRADPRPPLPFGHLGDGNIHYNVTQPAGADKAAFLERWDGVNAAVFAVVRKHGGSISAEHGVGVIKRDLLPKVKDPVAYELMHAPATLDPKASSTRARCCSGSPTRRQLRRVRYPPCAALRRAAQRVVDARLQPGPVARSARPRPRRSVASMPSWGCPTAADRDGSACRCVIEVGALVCLSRPFGASSGSRAIRLNLAPHRLRHRADA